jgi:hypothetical protein
MSVLVHQLYLIHLTLLLYLVMEHLRLVVVEEN